MKFFRNLSMIFLLAVLCFTTAWADSYYTKIYLPEESIEFADDMIFVDVDGEQMFVDALYSDDEGYYILQSALRECPGCGRKTFDTMKLKCPKCDFPDPDGRWKDMN